MAQDCQMSATSVQTFAFHLSDVDGLALANISAIVRC